MEFEKAYSNPLVTVITATFNLVKAGRVDYLHQCLEAVHSQTYQPIEHLIVDGASSDGTLDILREYEEKGWVKVYSEPDTGIYDAFNKGVRLATGKYCAFMNSDDFWHDKRGIEASVHMLEIGNGDFSYAPVTLLPEDGSAPLRQDPDLGGFFCHLPFVHQTMFCRTELLRELRFDQESYRLAADYDLSTRLLLSGRKGVFVPLNFTTFRLGGFSENAALHEEECTRLYRRYYGPIIGNEAANKLYKWIVPGKLVHTLASLVHPDVLEQMKRSFVPLYPADDELFVHDRPSLLEVEFLRRGQSQHYARCKWRGLLGLPLLKISTSRERSTWSLLNVLPVLVNKYSYDLRSRTRRTWLFGFLPFWKSVVRGDASFKHCLFFFIPVWSFKRY